MKRIAIIGGGIAGVTAGYELAKLAREGAPVEATLFECGNRFGGIVETVREGGFVIECGPDAWVTEKPWARELAEELGLAGELLASNDAARRTYILKDGVLKAIPDGMSMMVPTAFESLDESSLFSESAKEAYRDEPGRAAVLKATIPVTDESVASFVGRHFGAEVLETIAAPLLSGVLGGSVATLSVRAVMASYVAMEREHGSLVAALRAKAARNSGAKPALFTSLCGGLATLIERMVATIPANWLRMHTGIVEIDRLDAGWAVQRSPGGQARFHHGHAAHPQAECFDALMLATPVDVARDLLAPHDARAAALLEMDSSSAVIVAFALPDASRFPLPPGFGFLVPPVAYGAGSSDRTNSSQPQSLLLACTFTDQKFDHRVPAGGRLIRAFFGGRAAERLMRCNNDEIASIARMELARILGPMPEPQITVIRRWPLSLPQYAVGHLERMAELGGRVAAMPGLYLLGNGYRGVGLPDLIRDSRNAARVAGLPTRN
jgi:oxygen-dependent protoporphyrinogen oxidase